MVCCNSIVLRRILRGIVSFHILCWTVLNRLIVMRSVSSLAWRSSCKTIKLSSIFDLFRVSDWSGHIQILLLLSSDNVWLWRLILANSLSINSLIGVDSLSLLDCCWIGPESHFLFEIDFCLLVGLLSIFKLFISLVDEMITCSDMVVSIVLDTFLSVLSIEFIFFKQFLVKLFVNWHLFFAGE